MKAYQPKNIKEHNKGLLIQLLKDSDVPLTKRELAQASQLSVVTINKLIPELLETGIITEMANPIETGGRYATAFEFNDEYQLILINLFIERRGEMVVDFYVINLSGHIVDQSSLAYITLENFTQQLTAYKRKHPAISLSITGIPGVEPDNKLKIMDLATFKDLNLNGLISEMIQVPSLIENDVNAAALGFASDETAVLSSIYFPEISAPGGALIINQWIFKGHNNLSGEVKHLPFMYDMPFPLAQENRYPVIQDSIQSLVALYDPSDIVIFIPPAWNTATLASQLDQHIAQVFSYDTSVSIHISLDFDRYYLRGLIKLALSKVELSTI